MAKKDATDLSVEEKLKTLFQLQTALSAIDEKKALRGELPLEVEDLEAEIEGLNTRVERIQSEIDEFERAISQKKAVITYPEAHVWPWYTGIRPMKPAAFHFPITIEAPVFVATTTYQKTKFRKKPKITIYIDGPVKIPNNLSRKEKIRFLQNSVESIMKKRAMFFSE